ncbi:MAG: DNA-3-methyladenine glycosylase [Schumannella sp.]
MADHLVREGVPFREMQDRRGARAVLRGRGAGLDGPTDAEYASIDPRRPPEVRAVLSVAGSLAARSGIGGTAPERVTPSSSAALTAAVRAGMSLGIDLSRPSVEVAPELLGAVLHGQGVSVRITEVRAYLGDQDRGRTRSAGAPPATPSCSGRPGICTPTSPTACTCANVVCGVDGVATGVLLRAGEVIDGLELARERRVSTRTDADLARGPARLTVALGITLADGGCDLESGPIRLEAAPHPAGEYATSPRTGVAGEQFGCPGFWIPGDPTVSPYKRRHVPERRG